MLYALGVKHRLWVWQLRLAQVLTTSIDNNDLTRDEACGVAKKEDCGVGNISRVAEAACGEASERRVS